MIMQQSSKSIWERIGNDLKRKKSKGENEVSNQ